MDDDRLAYDNSLIAIHDSSSLLSDPQFHLENQRQVSVRHLARLKRLRAAEQQHHRPDSRHHHQQSCCCSEEEQREREQAVHMAITRLEEDLKVLAIQLDHLRSVSAEQRQGWRWSLPLLCVPYFLFYPCSIRFFWLMPVIHSVIPIIAFGSLTTLPRSQMSCAVVAACALLSAQTARREGAPRIYELLCEDIIWLKRTIAAEKTMAESEEEDILSQRWWRWLPYM